MQYSACNVGKRKAGETAATACTMSAKGQKSRSTQFSIFYFTTYWDVANVASSAQTTQLIRVPARTAGTITDNIENGFAGDVFMHMYPTPLLSSRALWDCLVWDCFELTLGGRVSAEWHRYSGSILYFRALQWYVSQLFLFKWLGCIDVENLVQRLNTKSLIILMAIFA